jgi:hypothetical protein
VDSRVRRTERNADEDRGQRCTGLIGSKVMSKLGEHGHETVAAAPSTGVNTLTGEGLADAFMPDEGQTTLELAGPGSALSADPTTIFNFVPATLPPTPTTDLYLKTSATTASSTIS